MTPVDISSSFLKSFYDHGDQAQQTESLVEENRQLREQLSAARVVIERQNQELESLRRLADCNSMPSPTTTKMETYDNTGSGIQYSLKEAQSQASSVSVGVSNCMNLPSIEGGIITAKVERAITSVSARKAWKPSTVRHCNGSEQKSDENDTASTCSLSLTVTSQKDDEHDELDDLVAFEGSSAHTSACKESATEKTRMNSDVTTKCCNTSTNAQDSLAKQHGKTYPMSYSSSTLPSNAHLTPPKRIPIAACLPPRIPQAAEILIHPQAMTLEVENHGLRDACQHKGIYTGSIDSRTLLPDGFGTMIYIDEEYVGDWEQGYHHGYGKHTNARGDVYEGPFHYGLKQGKDNATMNFGDGRRFHGRFFADKMREGVLHFVDGSWYEGLLENDKRDGYGLYCFVNGDEYEGQWKDGLMHGRGRMDWKSDASWYNGEWEFGIMNGMGTKVDSNGNIVHRGYFYNGEPVVFAEPMYEDDDYSTCSAHHCEE